MAALYGLTHRQQQRVGRAVTAVEHHLTGSQHFRPNIPGAAGELPFRIKPIGGADFQVTSGMIVADGVAWPIANLENPDEVFTALYINTTFVYVACWWDKTDEDWKYKIGRTGATTEEYGFAAAVADTQTSYGSPVEGWNYEFREVIGRIYTGGPSPGVITHVDQWKTNGYVRVVDRY